MMKMNKTFHLVIYIILLCTIGVLFYNNAQLKDSESAKLDTLTVRDTIYVRDTVKVSNPKIMWRKITDTILVHVTDSIFIPLPFEVKKYSNGKTYTAWVSGINPNLDSIHVYNNVVYTNTTNTVHVKEIERKWKTYLFVGCNTQSDMFYPSMGITFTSPKKWLFSAETGVVDKNPWLGVKVGYIISK